VNLGILKINFIFIIIKVRYFFYIILDINVNKLTCSTYNFINKKILELTQRSSIKHIKVNNVNFYSD
jgi:hypothetical protein